MPKDNAKPFSTEKPHKFFDVASTVVGREVRTGKTITFINEIDLTQIDLIRRDWAKERKPTYTAFVAKAGAIALRAYPYANRRLFKPLPIPFSRMRMQTFKDINIAVACERDEKNIEVATFMDIMKDVDQRNLSSISEWLFDLAHCDLENNKQWREFFTLICRFPTWLSSRLISLPLVSSSLWWKWRGGAMVISSPGKYGVDFMIGAWPAPLGVSFGFAKNRPVVKEDGIVAAKTMFLTLNWDRRIMAGAQAARFFKHMCDILENPREHMADDLS